MNDTKVQVRFEMLKYKRFKLQVKFEMLGYFQRDQTLNL